MNRLSEIALKYDTDKGPNCHNYTPVYHQYFYPIRNEVRNFLEIGVLNGASLQMWEEYFPNARIWGFDWNTTFVPDPNSRISIIHGDQGKKEDLERLKAEIKEPLDIIIDDGGHHMHQQILTFHELFPTVSPGGYFVIEDLHTSYSTAYGAIPGKLTAVDLTKNLIDEVQLNGRSFIGDPIKSIEEIGSGTLSFYEKFIDSIHIHKSLAIFSRRGVYE